MHTTICSKNNKQAENYLTDIVQFAEVILHNIAKAQQHEVTGVNTQKQLYDLEQFETLLN
jgi:bifunctional N-acetylglucosamine-1-phosphate-uridyltransferase/glucosamine-1-phosphate-acetyltransferase GlmU-like protein